MHVYQIVPRWLQSPRVNNSGRGSFLLLFSHNSFKWAEETGRPYGDMPAVLKPKLYACVRHVSLRQLGHWMMGSARIAGQSVTVSGAYGGDKGLPRDYESLTPAARAKTNRSPCFTRRSVLGGRWPQYSREGSTRRARVGFEDLSGEVTMKTYLVLWLRGGCIGRLPLTELEAARRLLHMSLIQRDISGTEHWNVFGEVRRSRITAPKE